ncbi:c-type cytochrome [Rhizobium leguminosarum]|jgi:mono/diheme cytochrome c family protein|nr:cytochrome c [Rhizobium leguminosarum]MBY2910171.1 c-type cytochrome [Rhizobium leguminosarum]MBY2917748.1 c-type cytochrome [Rhizobium leguminosarum]MBY2925400.1 c-type cytochrome [Rhizobium leguminosarum]MBY2943936.1 c-type cytochrome [Rhizobium leguminosarum]MBY2967568.1 c-type cytochrome [Rhizobium leguminosarum]
MLAAGAWLITKPNIPFEENDPAFVKPGDPARGELIFAAGDCSSCHATPGQKHRLQLGGGLALASPFGTFRPPNISQDAKDGIGSWTAADLGNALIGGVSPDGQHYYPVFPYPSYTGMTVDDVRDLFAYLKTLPAVSGGAPPHDLVALFRIRRFVGFWKLLFFDEGKSEAVLSGDPIHDRGAYLAESVAHCAECHSSRNVFGAIKQATRYAGGEDPEGTGFVPNITPARIGDWSQADIFEVLTSGNTPDHGRVGSSMADVVTNTAKLPAGDRDAIATYIKSLPARPTPQP